MKIKNKKGFTLIELLAVIVVLAIIALIATPIVMNTIKNAKKGAAERTADNYIKQVETTIAEKKLENNPLADGPYTIDSNGNLTGNGLTESVTIEMNGNKPSGGTIKISNGLVSKEGTTMTVGDYNVKYKDDKLTASEPYKGVLCKANTTKVTALVSEEGDPENKSAYQEQEVGLLASEATSKYDVGVTYTCELGDGEENTFYVLETSGVNVSLIAGFNLVTNPANKLSDWAYWVTETDYLAAGGTEADWCVSSAGGLCGNTNLGPITANKILKERTSAWAKLDEDQITLPSAEQIAKASGKTFDGKNFTSDLPTWLYSHIYARYSWGYWTSSPVDYDVGRAWYVHDAGYLGSNYYVSEDYYGIRPVITISKYNLS